MRTFVRPRQFDLVLKLSTSFSYFGSGAENLTVLQAQRFASSGFEEYPDGTVFAAEAGNLRRLESCSTALAYRAERSRDTLLLRSRVVLGPGIG